MMHFCDCFDDRVFHRRRLAFGELGNLIECRFDRDNGAVSQLHHARQYVEHWQQIRPRGLGLLFWGPPGTGKTFAAGCIANAFVESDAQFAPTVIMTTFGVILRRSLACSPQEREEYMKELLGCDLLILDDFGMERQTEFAREQVFNLINGRCLGGNPMVITTNLSLQQLKNPQTMAEHRIYDRVLEKCIPVCFEGESLRKAKAAENIRFYRDLLEGKSCES